MARGNETRTSCELSGPDFLCQQSEVEQSLMSCLSQVSPSLWVSHSFLKKRGKGALTQSTRRWHSALTTERPSGERDGLVSFPTTNRKSFGGNRPFPHKKMAPFLKAVSSGWRSHITSLPLPCMPHFFMGGQAHVCMHSLGCHVQIGCSQYLTGPESS